MRTVPFVALAFLLLGLAGSESRVAGQDPPKGPAPKSQVIYGQFRELMAEGKFDLAANFLQAFLDANPTDADLMDVEKKYGTTAFTGLRTVPKWSDDAALDKKTRGNVEDAVKRARAASEKVLRNPATVQKYINNLGATYEERVYAEQELRRAGEYAIPFLVAQYRTVRDTDKDLRDGILGTIPKLEGHTMAGWIAAFDGFTEQQRYAVLRAILSRTDVVALQSDAQTDLSPVLWRILALPPQDNATLRGFAEATLNAIRPGTRAATRVPEAELTALGTTFYDHKARFAGAKTNPDGSPTTVQMWRWDDSDAMTPKLVKIDDVPIGQAEEFYGLRYARWALEQKPGYEPAQALVLALAAERAIERANYGDLAKAEPAVFKLLSDAPSPILGDLLNRGLNQKKTGLALAMVQVIGERADKTSMPLLVKALGYTDPAVQVGAANALLRSPNAVPPEVRGKVVDVLRRAAAAEPGAPDAKGTALIADPSRLRAGATANLFRGLGYNVEVFPTGRDLLRRIGRSSDFDVLYIDHHTPNPELVDLIGQLQSNERTGNRPTFLVASTDKPRAPTFDQLIVRFAALIAATENQVVPMPPPFVPDPRSPPEEAAAARKQSQEKRDGQFRNTAVKRIERIKRVIEATGINLTETQRLLLNLRTELVTYAVLGTEYPLTPASSPDTFNHVANLRRQIDRQPTSLPYGVGTPTTDMLKLMERFEIDLARVPDAQKRFEDIYSKVDAAELGLPVETFRDEALEARLARSFRNYPAVRVVPEPFARSALAADLEAAQAEPGQAPRNPAEKKASQKVAVEWLRKLATKEVAGFEVLAAEPELRAALQSDDLADDAIAAVSQYKSGEAQQALLGLALNATKPLPIRVKAADATIKHVQANGKSIPKMLLDPLLESSDKEVDPTLRGKFLTLKGMLAHNPAEFLGNVRSYNPPLVPLPPPMPKEPEPKKDPAP